MVYILPHEAKRNVQYDTSGESRIIFLPERSSIYQYRPEVSAIIVKKSHQEHVCFLPTPYCTS